MRPPSWVRLCSVFKEPVPSSGGFPVSREFPLKSRTFWGRLEGDLQGSCSRLFSGFARWKDRARAPPGEVEDTESARGCQADISREVRKRSEVFIRTVRVRRLPARSRAVSVRSERAHDLRTERPGTAKGPLIPLRDKGFHRRTFPPLCSGPEGKGEGDGVAIPLKWDFHSNRRSGGTLSRPGRPPARDQAGKVRRRPDTAQPPARRRPIVAG